MSTPTPADARLDFERLLVEVSARLVSSSDETFDATVEAALGQVTQFFGADRGAILGVEAGRGDVRALYIWYSDYAVDRVDPSFPFAELFPWAYRFVKERREPVILDTMDDLPPEAGRDRATYESLGDLSNLSLPIFLGPDLKYFLTLDAMHRHIRWPRSFVPRVQLLGEIFANAVERRRSVRRLRASEARLDLVLQSAGAGPWDVDLASGRVWATPEARALYGLPPDEDATLEMVFAAIHPEDAEHVRARIAQARQSSFEFVDEYRVVRPGNVIRWIVARGRVREDIDPPARHLLGVSIDVTARKEAEAERRANMARLQAAADVAGLAFYVMADEGRVTSLDARAREFLGIPRQEESRAFEFWKEHLHPEDRQRVLAVAESAVSGLVDGVLWEEYRYLHPDGRVVWYHHWVTSIERDPSGRATTTLGAFQDITDRMHAAETIRASEEVNRATFEQAAVGIAHVGTDGGWMRVNDKLCAILGYTREELTSGLTIQDLTHPEDREQSVADLQAMLAGQLTNFSRERRHVRRDGTVLWAYVTVSLLRGADGPPRHFILIIEDITARKEAEATLARAHAEVQRLRDQLERENIYLRQETRTLRGWEHQIVGQSPAIRRALADAEKVAATPSTVLLLGETGTGKDLFANAIHELSPRRDRAMIRVNCAAIPVTLIESELFGRERGAYTGALSRQVGRFELASGSTIFLDEIGELPPDIQVKLLRVLQDRQIERLGNPKPIPVDLRVIAATNRNLERDVRDGRFREDLYYRLNVFPVRVPALRERREDIPLIVESLIAELAGAIGKRIESVSRTSMDALVRYDWPGNVRELRNAIERALILATGPVLDIAVPGGARDAEPRSAAQAAALGRDELLKVLEETRWRIRGKGGAAERLNIKPTTLESRMERLGIRRS